MVLQQFDLIDVSGWVCDVKDRQYYDLSVVMVQLGDDDFSQLFISDGKIHGQHGVWVQFVIYAESGLGYGEN